MKIFKNNKKLFLGILVGLVLSGITVYATNEILFSSSQISFDNTRAGLTKPNGDSVETLEDAIEALANNHSGDGSSSACPNSPFNLGDYVDMQPTLATFSTDTTYTNYTSSQELHPNYLNVWRVIKINSDCTVEVVSEYVSDVNVYFKGKVGYQNLVYYLNEIAKQYANTQFTLNPATAPDGAFRNVGYDGQTKQIDLNATLPDGYMVHPLEDENLGKTEKNGGHWYKKAPDMEGVYEYLGGGDFKFATDLKLMADAGVSAVAYKKTSVSELAIGNATKTAYWLASRLYVWNGEVSWYFYARYMADYGYIYYRSIYSYGNSSFSESSLSCAVRPIVTLDPSLFTVSGLGTSASHRVLTAKS